MLCKQQIAGNCKTPSCCGNRLWRLLHKMKLSRSQLVWHASDAAQPNPSNLSVCTLPQAHVLCDGSPMYRKIPAAFAAKCFPDLLQHGASQPVQLHIALVTGNSTESISTAAGERWCLLVWFLQRQCRTASASSRALPLGFWSVPYSTMCYQRIAVPSSPCLLTLLLQTSFQAGL
jgi:hypothetical protein